MSSGALLIMSMAGAVALLVIDFVLWTAARKEVFKNQAKRRRVEEMCRHLDRKRRRR